MSVVFRHPVGVLRPTVTQDGQGNDQFVYPAVAQATQTLGWAVDTTGTQEDTDGRSGTVTRLTLRRRGAPVVLASDRLVWAGVVYLIEGDVQYQPGPSAATSHTIVSLKLAKG